MKIEQLIQVIEVAEIGSITKAAEKLFMSQSNLSASLRDLEKEMNAQIFIRSNNGTQLTDFGSRFLAHARSVVSQFEYIRNMSSTQGTWVNHFSVSAYHFLFANYIFCELFREDNSSNMIYDYLDCSRSEVLSNISNKKCELGILSIPSQRQGAFIELLQSNDMEYHKITLEIPHILVGSNNPVVKSGQSCVTMTQLKEQTLVSYHESTKFFQEAEQEMFHHFTPSNIIRISDRGTLVRILQSTDSYHVAVKNHKAYQHRSFHEGIHAIPIENCPYSIEIGWLKLKNSFLSQLGKRFLVFAQKALVLENPQIITNL